MRKGNHGDQQQHIPTSEEIPEYPVTNIWFNETPSTSLVDSNDAASYADIVKVLSQVDLPSPSPIVATSCSSTREDNMIGFHQGQLSGTKNVYDIEGNIEWYKELKDEDEYLQEPVTQFVAPETHDTEQFWRSPPRLSTGVLRCRNRIPERIRALKELVPNCNKRDQASILDDAIKYITSLQMQVQMMQCMGSPQGLYMPTERNLSMQVPYLAPCLMRRPMIGPEYNAPRYGTYFSSRFPIFPPFVSGVNPLVLPMDVGTGSPRLLPIHHHLQFPLASVPLYSTTLSSDTLVTTTGSQLGSGISSQSPYHMPMMSQEMQQLPLVRVRANPQDHLTMGTHMPENDSSDE